MRTYNEYLTEVQHSQPFVKVSIAGVDVTDRLVREMGIETDALLDTPELSVFTASEVVVYLTNHDNYFSAKKRPNFFTENSLEASGWRVPLLIQGGFVGLSARVFFFGEIEEVRQVPGKRWVRVLVLDLSTRLRYALVDDFGESVIRDLFGAVDAPNYSEVNPVYQLGVGDLPISRESLKARIGNENLTVYPSLPEGGASGDYRDIAVNLNTGVLTFGGEPPNKNRTTLNLSFKTVYRYRTPEFLIYELAKAQGFYTGMSQDEQGFARSLLQSPTLRHSRNVVSSLGRPKSQTDKPVIRGITSDLDRVYLCGDRSLLQYRRRGAIALDTYTLIGACPDTDAVLLSVLKDDDNFYLLSSASFSGHLTSKIWKFDGSTWTELAGPSSGEPTTAYPYDYVTATDPVSDNRKSFILHSGYLYFVYGNNSTTGGLNIQRNGVRRINISTGAIETVFSQGTPADYGIDFIIHNEQLYVFVCQRGAGNQNFLRLFRMGLSGSSPTEIFTEQFDRGNGYYPATVSDIAVLDNHFYFVFAQHRTRIANGIAELSRLPVAGGTRGVLKIYENMLFGPRSLTEYKGRIYFVEGQWISGFSNKTYPTFSDAGHLQSIDRHGMIVDEGGVWRSYYDKKGGTGLGMHTAFPSNLHYDNLTDSLFFIAGYGLPIDVDADSIATVNTPLAQDLTNWVWLQYGQNLSTRISEFRTNGISAWELMSRLAKVVDWEIGFTEAVNELDALYTTNPTIERFTPKRYLFFRPRSMRQSDLVLDGSVNVEVSSAVDTTLVFNHIVVAYGDGHWIEKDDALIDEIGSRFFEINTGLLGAQDGAWAEILARRYLERQRVPRQKVSSLLKFAPQLELGQYLEITSEWNAFQEVPFQLTQIEHFSESWQTRIEGREIVAALEPLQFSGPIEDVMFVVGDSVSEVLPAATGGLSPLSYTLTGLATGLSFAESTRTYYGNLTEAGVFLATYTALDSSDPALTIVGRFKIIVKSSSMLPPTTPKTTPVKKIWSGVALNGAAAYVLSDASNEFCLYTYPSTLSRTVGIGTGEWVDIAADSSLLYFLDATEATPKIKSLSLPLASGATLPPTDFITLDAGSASDRNKWLAITVSDTKLYALAKIAMDTNAPDPDYRVFVWNISGTPSRVMTEDIDLKLEGNFTSMAIVGNILNILVEDFGITLHYDITTKAAATPLSGQVILDGSVDWVGLDASTVMNRTGLYALQKYGTRILAFTNPIPNPSRPSRRSTDDYVF